jgi:ubiquinone/menaquinone biosynthesis C-methylase UbiE
MFAAPPQAEASVWEQAYLRFESPQQEIRKFQRRLIRLGADQWAKDSQIVELFCGRGNGLRALHWLGFSNVQGIDLSPCLASRYRGPGQISVGDCRSLPFADQSRDILIVQGGLHHLVELPADLDQTLAEAARVLRAGGRFVAVEPWLTPFLRLVHFVSEQSIVRATSGKLDALATMIENERETYEQWLNNSALVLRSLQKHFDMEIQTIGWGKLNFVGKKR